MATVEEDNSYIDYDTFLDPSFHASEFANALVLTTNNPTDSPLDLTTPLSRVLFDAQEINTHIDTLTTSNALPLLAHTQEQTSSSKKILQEVDAQVASLNDNYKRLEKEVLVRYETAEEVRSVAGRLWETVRLGRAVGRCLQLGRQLEIQVAELTGSTATSRTNAREDHRALIRSANTLLTLRELFSKSGPGEEGEGLAKINVVSTLRTTIVAHAERTVISKAQQIVREFSMSGLAPSANTNTAPTFNQATETKSRTTSALITLYLLSPLPPATTKHPRWEPELLLNSLQEYLRAQLSSSLASLTRALAALPTLERTALEVAARCQNILALESLLSSIIPPTHPLLQNPSRPTKAFTPPANLLQPLLASLETGSLPSYFWRSLAGGLTSRVQDIMMKGGLNARTLKSNRNAVRDIIRECVIKGCTAPAGIGAPKDKRPENVWEREVAVMVGSIMGPLSR